MQPTATANDNRNSQVATTEKRGGGEIAGNIYFIVYLTKY
jgi:hypothetical protein